MHYIDTNRSAIEVQPGRIVPADPRNTDYQLILASGVTIADAVPPLPTDADATAEYRRRLCAILGADNLAHAGFIRADNDVEMRRLETATIRTAEEEAWLAELHRIDRAVADLITCYNALPAPPPLDFAADRHWQRPA
ncbi:MAG: hypothetical protein ACKVP7_18095 [Hyphomicrobiaceae bacterium]